MTIKQEMSMAEEINSSSSASKHIMAFTFGAVIPCIFSMWSLPFVGMWLSGLVFCIYAFERQESEASAFGMTISAMAIILILGSIEMNDQLSTINTVATLPSYVMR